MGDKRNNDPGGGKVNDQGGAGLSRYQRQQKGGGGRSMTMGQSERRLAGSRESSDRERARCAAPTLMLLTWFCLAIPVYPITCQCTHIGFSEIASMRRLASKG